MERLLSPDLGLSVWTILTFFLLVVILAKTVWKPLIRSLEEREEGIRLERKAAETARRDAEDIKAQLDKELALIEARAKEALDKAVKEGLSGKEKIIEGALQEAKDLVDRTRKQLEEEKARLVRELRGEIAGLSVLAAERILKESVKPETHKRVLADFLKDLENRSKAG